MATVNVYTSNQVVKEMCSYLILKLRSAVAQW